MNDSVIFLRIDDGFWPWSILGAVRINDLAWLENN